MYGARRGVIDKDGRTALHYASHRSGGGGDEDSANVVESLIKELITTSTRRGPDALSAFVDRQDGKGKTALHRAAYHGQLRAVQTLIGCNADVRVKDKLGCTALLAAADAKDVDEVNTLYL